MGIFSSIIGGLFGSANTAMQNQANLQAQREANQTNMQIAQMNNEYNQQQFEKQLDYNTDMWNKQSQFQDSQLDKQNAFNEKMMDKSNQFQLDMWNKNNEYNSASAQRQRLEDAGLNPYLMMSGGSAGSASFSGGTSASSGSGSSPSALGVSPPTASPVSVSPVMSDLSGVNTAIQSTIENIMQSQTVSASTDKMNTDSMLGKIEAKYKAANLMQDILAKSENTKNTRLRNAYQSIINEFARDSQIADLNHVRQQVAIGKMQENLYATDYAMKQMQTVALPEQIKIGIAQGWASVVSTKVNTRMTQEQIRKIAQDYLESVQRTQGIKLSNRERDAVFHSIVETAEAQARKARNNVGSDNPWQFMQSEWQNNAKRFMTGSIY